MLLMWIHRSQGMTQVEAHEIQPDIAACLSSLCYCSARALDFKGQGLGSILFLHHIEISEMLSLEHFPNFL